MKQQPSGVSSNIDISNNSVDNSVANNLSETNNSSTYNFYSQIKDPVKKKAVADNEINAIRIGVPDKIRNDVKTYDPATLSLAQDMINQGESVGKTMRFENTPRDLAGKNFTETYGNFIEKPRRDIGKKINERVSALPKKPIDITDSLSNLEDSLFNNGVAIIRGENGTPKLTLLPESSLTDQQFNIVKNLYERSILGGNAQTPLAIRNKDAFFSKARREAIADNVADLTYTKADGTTSNIYDDFKSVFSNKLAEVDPDLKQLLTDYAPYAQLRDLVEPQILGIKPSKQVSGQKLSDFYKNAGLNLRKMTSNYNSANDLTKIVESVEELARQNGYKGASNIDANLFARELEKYFDIKPSGSLGGMLDDTAEQILDTNLPTSKEGIVQKVLEVGKATRGDQAKAIKDYIESLTNAFTE